MVLDNGRAGSGSGGDCEVDGIHNLIEGRGEEFECWERVRAELPLGYTEVSATTCVKLQVSSSG